MRNNLGLYKLSGIYRIYRIYIQKHGSNGTKT